MKRKCIKKIIFVPVVVAIVLLVFFYLERNQDVVGVSSSASGKELPIYCVQTDEPKISISFDGAWGNGKMW